MKMIMLLLFVSQIVFGADKIFVDCYMNSIKEQQESFSRVVEHKEKLRSILDENSFNQLMSKYDEYTTCIENEYVIKELLSSDDIHNDQLLEELKRHKLIMGSLKVLEQCVEE